MFSKLLLLLLLPWRRRAAERDMQEELQSIAAMAEPGELGNLTLAAEDARATWSWIALEQLARDIRYGLRGLRRSPAFTVTALLSLALGIGANTALFSLWNGVLRAPLPVVDKPQQLVMLTDPAESGSWTGMWDGRTDGPRAWITYEEFEQLRDHAGVFSSLMASQSSLAAWPIRVDGGVPEEARGRLVSGEFFEVLGVQAARGRTFLPADEPSAPVVVISDAYWQRRFAGRPDVVGHTLTVRKTSMTIVGVMPPRFIGETHGQQPDLWMPLTLQPDVMPDRDRLHDTAPEKSMWLHAFGRLKPGVTLEQAQERANVLFHSGLESFYGAIAVGERRADFMSQDLRLQYAARGASAVRGEFSGSLSMLLAGVGVLLVIACANLANLLLARGAARRHEMALRLSLGANRGRLIRQLITESLAVATLGGAAAMVVASALHGLLVRMLAESDSRFSIPFTLDPRVVGFAIGATLVALVLFGVLPALQVTRTSAVTSLNEQGRGTTSSRRRMRAGRLLVGFQLALSLPLLFGAGLLARTAWNLQHADLGFVKDRLLLVRVDLREVAGDDVRRGQVRAALLDEIRRLPSVRAASYSQLGLFTGGESSASIVVEGYTPRGDNDRESALDTVGPRYFTTLGIRLLAGRDVQDSDGADAARICVINQAFARQFFEARNPLGRHITTVGDSNERTTCEVVGVAADAHTSGVRAKVVPRFFVSAAQRTGTANSPILIVRTTGPTASAIEAVRTTVRRIDAALPIVTARTIEEQMAPITAQDRTTATLAMIFGGVALVLTAVGLYGVLSYGVAKRTNEIAIRIALGAVPGRVVSMILRETTGLFVAGLTLGAGLVYETSRLIGSQLYGVAAQDPLTLAATIGVLLAVALTAAFLPARRASRLNPIKALRI